MEANAERLAKPKGGKPKRRLRNYLLDARFQLKYTSMVVAVAISVAGVLGYFAHNFSKGMTESLALNEAMQADPTDDSLDRIMRMSEEKDAEVLLAIIGGIALLGVALAVTGIIVTHKVVGPAYKLRMLLNEVAEGKLKLAGRLRKGDELQELFEAFAGMVEALRDAQAREVAQLDSALDVAREAGVAEENLQPIIEVRDRMQAQLD